jgi:hypothetical protein
VDDERRRASRRAFIRAGHPDRGGDPAAFAAGLARLDQRTPDRMRVAVIAHQRWPVRLMTALMRCAYGNQPPQRVR